MEGDIKVFDDARKQDISIHSLRMEGDGRTAQETKWIRHFNPLPPHGGRHLADRGAGNTTVISIHSLRMEGD